MPKTINPIQTTNKTISIETPARIIGRIKGKKEGPVIFVFAGMHGNEPAGIAALGNLFSTLEGCEEHYSGLLVGMMCNLQAYNQGVRFVDEDMNRIWFPSIIDKIRRCPEEELESSERVEIKKILEIIDREIPPEHNYPVIFVDLHSFSAQGSMFAITRRQQLQIDIISSMHIPMIFGIEEALRGTAIKYFQDRGYVSIAFEGGNHQNKLTIKNNQAAMGMLISRVGSLSKARIPQYEEYEQHLNRHSERLPSQVELVYQHMIENGDDFEMRPGYKNFQPVKEGEWLANDRNGQIRAQCDGYILMPLYQKQGDDGFFIVRQQT